MTASITRYRLTDGSQVAGSANAIRTDVATIAAAALRASSSIPAGVFVGIAIRETDRDGETPVVNQCDTDFNDDGGIKAQTYGIFQLGRGDAAYAVSSATLDPAAAYCDPETGVQSSCDDFAAVLRGYVAAIAAAAGVSPDDDSTFWCYVCWAHSNGLSAVLKSIANFGLDWEALKARPQNDYMRQRMIPYAEAVLEWVRRFPTAGGADGTPTADTSATLRQLLVLLFIGWLLIKLAPKVIA